MRIRVVPAGAFDLSAAPLGGALYLDALIGSERNPGTRDRPKRYLPSTVKALAAGETIYLRGGQRYRRRLQAPARGECALSVAFAGASGNRAALKSWGDAPALIGGDTLLQSWRGVEDNFGNAFLATNGQQVSLPEWASMWDAHFVGADMLMPSFWSPNCPNDLAQVCRHEWYSMTTDADAWGACPNVQATQTWGPISQDLMLYENPNSLTYQVDGGTETYAKQALTIWLRDPAIAAHYGAGDGPVGAWLSFRTAITNLMATAIITGYDYARSEIVAKTVLISTTSGGALQPADNCSWRILGHPFDLRQQGQYACLVPLSGGKAQAWRVVGDWMRGASTWASYTQIAQLSGDYQDLAGLTFERSGGWHIKSFETNYAEGLPGQVNVSPVYVVGSNTRWRDIAGGRVIAPESTTAVFTQPGNSYLTGVDIDGWHIYQTWTCRGIGGLIYTGTVNDLTIEECGRSGWIMAGNSDPAGLRISDVLGRRSASVHGNLLSFYFGGMHQQVTGYTAVECTRGVTWQSSGNDENKPRQSGLDAVFILDATQFDGTNLTGYAMRVDSLMDHSTWQNVQLMDGTFQFLGGMHSDALLDRCYFNGLSSTGGSNWGPETEEDGPVTFRDVLNGGKDATEIAALGATAIRVTKSAQPDWAGSHSEDEWEYLTRKKNDATHHQETPVGAQRFGWTLPAYDAGDPQPGAPVALQLSQTDFYAQMQANGVVAVVLGARPLSILSLPSGVDDNDLVTLARGRIRNIDRLTADLTITVRETPQAKIAGVWTPQPESARDTQFTLRCVR